MVNVNLTQFTMICFEKCFGKIQTRHRERGIINSNEQCVGRNGYRGFCQGLGR